LREFWLLASGILLIGARLTANTAKPVSEDRLAELRPLQDNLGRVCKTYANEQFPTASKVVDVGRMLAVNLNCSPLRLVVTANARGVKEGVAVENTNPGLAVPADCVTTLAETHSETVWQTGKGLQTSDLCDRAEKIYGPAESESAPNPSNSDVKSPIYDLGWAGPKVPQVLKIRCSISSNRVVRMTLFASKP
jgi:hypothetical protein